MPAKNDRKRIKKADLTGTQATKGGPGAEEETKEESQTRPRKKVKVEEQPRDDTSSPPDAAPLPPKGKEDAPRTAASPQGSQPTGVPHPPKAPPSLTVGRYTTPLPYECHCCRGFIAVEEDEALRHLAERDHHEAHVTFVTANGPFRPEDEEALNAFDLYKQPTLSKAALFLAKVKIMKGACPQQDRGDPASPAHPGQPSKADQEDPATLDRPARRPRCKTPRHSLPRETSPFRLLRPIRPHPYLPR